MEFLKELRTSFNLTQDELAKKLMLEDGATIAQYETKINPSMKVLIRITEVFDLSLDFIVNNKSCIYPRNLKLLRLANSFDDSAHSQSRSLVEASIDVFMKQKPTNELKQDSIDLDLKNDFHSNLKSIRIFKGISQLELANSLDVGRTAVTLLENRNFPTLENLQKLSSHFDISMHALVTGQKLTFQFTDGHFGKTMLLADRLLTLEEHKYLIKLMENILAK